MSSRRARFIAGASGSIMDWHHGGDSIKILRMMAIFR
jgi:hypothetical protein